MAREPSTTAIPDRRQRYREYMKCFNPTAPARTAINEGLVGEEAGRSVYKKLAAGADLSPGSQQLVVGGIGSGKTTELLLAERELGAHEGLLPVYIDVSAETDLSAVSSGALLASMGLGVWGAIVGAGLPTPKELSKLHAEIRKAAYGDEVVVYQGDYDGPEPYYETVRIPGKLKPPFPAILRDVSDLADSISTLTEFLKVNGREVVVIFDGLDRLMKVEPFWSVAEQDLRAIRPLGISVLAAGPLSILFGKGRQVKDYFDEVHYLPPAIADPEKSPFLFEILRLRGAGEMMHPDQMQRICRASGGVLRDLISVARNAGQAAYLDDADEIEATHVDRSIEQLGNGYLLGLGARQKSILREMLNGGGFDPSDSINLELLLTRRVLEQSESRYEVHPALAAILVRTPENR